VLGTLILGAVLLAGCTTGGERPVNDETRVTASDVDQALASEEASAAAAADTPATTGGAPTEVAPSGAAADSEEAVAVEAPVADEPEESEKPEEPEPVADEVVATPEPPPTSVDLRIADASEREAVASALEGAGFALLADGAPTSNADGDANGDGGVIVSDAPLPAQEAINVRPWVVVAHQRQDVLALSRQQVESALSGSVVDWSSFGGVEQALRVFLPEGESAQVRNGLGLAALVAIELPLRDVVAAVRGTPGALALLPPAALQPGLLPIVVDGYDPLRDPDADNPLWLRRWLRAPDGPTRQALIDALGWAARPADNPLGLLATGDFIPARCVVDSVHRFGNHDFNSIFAGVGDALRAADVTVVSMEVAIVPEANVSPCLETFILSGPIAAVPALAAAGVDALTLAGNHSADCYFGCGRAVAIQHTIETLDEAGIAHTGTGENLTAARRPVLIERDGVRLAILSYELQAAYYFATADAPGVAAFSAASLREDVAAALAIADHVIVAFSAGEEYVQTTLPLQDAAVRVAFEAGASLVIGNHPHTVQPLIEQEGRVAAFALGNFVFDQDWSRHTTQSVILEAGFNAERLLGYRVRPSVIRFNYQPELVDPAGAEGVQILTRLWGATDAWNARQGS